MQLLAISVRAYAALKRIGRDDHGVKCHGCLVHFCS